MGTNYTTFGQLNAGGINAPLADATNVNRHVITTGAGMDPNSNNTVPVVAPGGGTYSLRLGNGSVGTGPGSTSLAEGIRLTFTVNPGNAGFTYRYAFFVNNPGHAFESQPSFEVVVLDQNDSIIPCGRYFVVAGNYPACVNSSGFQNGTGGYVFKNWTNVGLDLTGYIGKNVSVEFRTTDCDPAGGGSSTTCSGSICTYCTGGNCCTYPAGGTQCTPTGGGCTYAAGTHSAYAYIDAYCSPLSVISPTFCAGASSISICAPTGYLSYTWPAGQPGLPGSPTTQCVTINNPVAGNTYTVNMVSATGCPTSTTVTLLGATVQVNSPTICAGVSTTLTASGGNSYTWSTGESTSAITVAPTVTTTYTVTTDIGGCTATATSTVTVGTVAATITPPTAICLGESTTLCTSGGTTYSWSTGETTSCISVTPSATGDYSVVVTNGACIAAGTTTVTVNSVTATVTPPTTICSGSTTTLTATGGGSYIWSTGATGPTLVLTPGSSTNYSVVVTNGGCKDTAYTSITVDDVTATITPPLSICSGQSATLTATGGTSYSWSNGATGPTITVSPTGTTSYTVTVTNGICSTTATTSVNVGSVTPGITGPTAICVGTTVSITATGGGTYLWSNGSTSPTIVVSPGTTTNYSVVITNGICSATANTIITVSTLTTGFVDVTSISCDGISVAFTDQSLPTSSSWLWNFGDGSTSTQQNPVHPYPVSGVYTITLTSTNGPCTGVSIGSVTILDLSASIGPANVFSPNADGINDCFLPALVGPGADTLRNCIYLEVFDRWGIKMFESSGTNICWNGNNKKDSKPAKDGTYYYIAKLGQNTIKGYVTLVRHK